MNTKSSMIKKALYLIMLMTIIAFVIIKLKKNKEIASTNDAKMRTANTMRNYYDNKKILKKF